MLGIYEFQNSVSSCSSENILNIIESIRKKMGVQYIPPEEKAIKKDTEEKRCDEVKHNNKDEIKSFSDIIKKVKLEGYKGIDFYPEKRKQDNAYENYKIPRNEKIYALIDSTVMGSAKNGLAVTSSGIYWHNDFFTKSSQTHLNWDELKDCGMDKGWMCVKFGKNCEFDLSGSDANSKTVIAFLDSILNLRENTALSDEENILNDKQAEDSRRIDMDNENDDTNIENNSDINTDNVDLSGEFTENPEKEYSYLKQHIKNNDLFKKICSNFEYTSRALSPTISKGKLLNLIDNLIPEDDEIFRDGLKDQIDDDSKEVVKLMAFCVPLAHKLITNAMSFKPLFSRYAGESSSVLLNIVLDNEVFTFLTLCYFYSLAVVRYSNKRKELLPYMFIFVITINKYLSEREKTGDLYCEKNDALNVIKIFNSENKRLTKYLFLSAFKQDINDCLSSASLDLLQISGGYASMHVPYDITFLMVDLDDFFTKYLNFVKDFFNKFADTMEKQIY